MANAALEQELQAAKLLESSLRGNIKGLSATIRELQSLNNLQDKRLEDVIKQRDELAERLELATAYMTEDAVNKASDADKLRSKERLETVMGDFKFGNSGRVLQPRTDKPVETKDEVNDLLGFFMGIAGFGLGMIVMYLFMEFA